MYQKLRPHSRLRLILMDGPRIPSSLPQPHASSPNASPVAQARRDSVIGDGGRTASGSHSVPQVLAWQRPVVVIRSAARPSGPSSIFSDGCQSFRATIPGTGVHNNVFSSNMSFGSQVPGLGFYSASLIGHGYAFFFAASAEGWHKRIATLFFSSTVVILNPVAGC